MHGLTLQLDHIVDPGLHPLNVLFQDHFLQGILMHMKAVGEPMWDYKDNLGGGAFDLLRHNIWGGIEGQERLELELADRSFDHRVAQDLNM